MTDDTLTPPQKIDRLIEELPDWRSKTLAAVRKAVLTAGPAIEEDWKWMGTPTWSHQGHVCIANPHKDKVKVTFSHGASLPDPESLFNNGLGGKVWRAIDLYKGDELNVPAFQALVRAGAEFNAAKKKRK